MTVNQIYSIVNDITQEITGKTDIVTEDLSNVVDVGTEIFNATSVDNYVKTLVNRVGRTIFVDRQYKGNVPSVYMDKWDFGSVLQKIQADLPTASENTSWELVNGNSYDPNIFYKPSVTAKFFNSKITFEVPMSFTERQVKESFNNATELNAFISMLYNSVEKAMTIKIDSLIMRTINTMTALTIDNDFSGGTGLSNGSTSKCVNLLKLYNSTFGTTLTKDKALTTPDFVRFASMQISLYIERLTKMSTLFNIGGKERFTPKDNMTVVLLNDFVASTKAYLESTTFHNELVALPNAEIVPYWQGSGESYDFNKTSSIDVKYNDTEISVDGILGVVFDKEALGVTNLDRRVTTNYNPKAEFYNNWYKFDAGYFIDNNENFIVFLVQ